MELEPIDHINLADACGATPTISDPAEWGRTMEQALRTTGDRHEPSSLPVWPTIPTKRQVKFIAARVLLEQWRDRLPERVTDQGFRHELVT